MLTLLAYARYAERRGKRGEGLDKSKVQSPKSKVGERGSRVEGRVSGTEHPATSTLHDLRYYALALLFFALGLMSKPMLVTLPCVLLLLDYWPLGRWRGSRVEGRGSTTEHETRNTEHGTRTGTSNIESRGVGTSQPQHRTPNIEGTSEPGLQTLLWEKIPFFLLAAAASVVTFAVQKSGGAIIARGSLSDRIVNALMSYCRYLGKILWPVDLAAFYPPAGRPPLAQALAAVVFLAGISLLAVALRPKRPWLLVGWLWFLGTLVPVIGLVPAGEQSMADRYSYVPSIGILLVAVWGGCEIARRWMGAEPVGNYPAGRRLIPLIVAAVLAATAVLCSKLTREQVAYWKDTEILFRHALRVTKNNYLAHNNVGTALDKQGRLEEAASEFQEALKAKPNYAEAHNNLGVVLGEQGRLEEALSQYAVALKVKPGYADPHNNRGTILEKLGRMDEAIHEYEVAVRIQPGYADAHSNLGAALGRTGRWDEAIAEFRQVLNLQPYSAEAHNNLGVELDGKGKLDEAITQFKEAVRVKPDYAWAYYNLGGGLSRNGELDGAIGEFREALSLKPDYAAAQTNLAVMLGMKRRLEVEKEGKQ